MSDKRILKYDSFVRSRVFGRLPGVAKDVAGIEFHGLKEYEPGDPISDINRTASRLSGERLVTLRMPDRELLIVCLVDTTRSMDFGSKKSKVIAILVEAMEMAREVRAKFMLAFPDESRDGFACINMPRGVTGDAHEYFSRLIETRMKSVRQVFEIGKGLSLVRKHSSSRSLYAVIVSDFLFEADYGDAVRPMTRPGNSIIAVATLDPIESAPPQPSSCVLRVRDSETGKCALMAFPPEHYLDAHRALWKKLHSPFEVFDIQGE